MSSPRPGRLAGLDGLRAIAVGAVLAYHLDPSIVSGGFLGVDLFFVISGFLITALLLGRAELDGGVDVVAFWQRRIRRLVPAVVLLCAAVLVLAVVTLPDELGRVRRDVVGALAWVTNWQLLVGGDSYFEAAARPPLLRHLWSLGVEAQFYLVWPLVLAAALRIGRSAVVALVALGGALASAAWMAVLYVPETDPSRVYFGTDTRLTPLLVGATLAALIVAVPSVAAPRRRATRAGLAVVGLAALAFVAGSFVVTNAFDPVLYRGGLLAFAAVSGLLILALVAVPRLGAALDVLPLRWLGERSYGIYLWHWPVYLVTRPGIDIDLDPVPAAVLRIGLTLLLAALSYRFVELPIRRAGWRAATSPFDGFRRRRRRPAFAPAFVGASSLALVAILAGTTALPVVGATERPSYLPVDRVSGVIGTSSPAPPGDEPGVGGPEPTPSGAPVGGPTARPGSSEDPGRTERPGEPPSILALGDSVMISAIDELARRLPGIEVDAEIGRFFPDAVALLDERRATRGLPDIVIVHLGNNGPFFHRQFDELMTALADVRLVVFVNLKVPRDWEAVGNEVLARGTSHYPNAVLVDWHAVAASHPELFWRDGYHVRAEGGELYAGLIVDALASAGVAVGDPASEHAAHGDGDGASGAH